MTDHELVKSCMRRILNHLGFDNTDALTQRDLEFFCDQVEEKTGILISLSTAKRLLHAQFSKLPQVATLNAITQFLGYANWQEYKQKEKDINEETNDTLQSSGESQQPSLPIAKHFKRKRIVALAAAVVAMFFLIAFVNGSIGKKPNFKSASFHAEKTTANSIPNTVVFHYNVDNVNADSFFIQQSWDKNRRVRVYKNHYTLTDIYYEPGYHTAKLIANDKIIKTFAVSIPTDNWFFCAKPTLGYGVPEYIEKSKEDLAQLLGLTREDLTKNGIDTRSEKQFICSYFPSKMEINSDDFVLKARVRRTTVRNDYCPYLMLEVFCQKNFMFFKTMKSGCSSNAMAQFGENFLSGKEHDLSTLSTDINEWQDFEFAVKNRKVAISINGRNVFTSSYKESSGLITGLGFISNGLCEIENAELKGGNGKVMYAYKAGETKVQ